MSNRNPWMYTTIILAVIAIGLTASNIQATGYILSNMDGMEAGNNVKVANPTPTQPQPAPTQPTAPSVVGDLTDNDPMKGDANAPITIVEFSDFQCPFCSRFYTDAYPRIIQEYVDTGKAKIVYRDFPLTSLHPQAQPAAEASECANEQGMFWEFHDKIFENQGSMSPEAYKQWAADIGLNTEQFNSCFDSGKYRSEVQKDLADGQAAGVSGTPTFFINGQKLVGAQPFEAFKAVIDNSL
ncbi:MAG: DsbA family protein [Candidatus Aenigmatarchaeota archaeon]|nr:DsbA family protein [Nanoarchaeota archaeon]